MKAGKLRHKITIQKTTQTADSIGGIIDSWSTFATVWAHIEPLKGKETLQGEQISTDLFLRITIRYLSGLTAKMRISWNSRTFDIKSISNLDERNREMELLCVEVLT
jgi:SPP1 family predicted phage head-tail adaptor